jgi:hypothetical protein
MRPFQQGFIASTQEWEAQQVQTANAWCPSEDSFRKPLNVARQQQAVQWELARG